MSGPGVSGTGGAWASAALVAALLLWMTPALPTAVQLTPHADPWGDPVDGVQLRLSIPKDAQQNPAAASMPCRRAPSGNCGPPSLDMQMRNLGTDTVKNLELAAAAGAALDLAQSTLGDAAYVGPNIHTLLLRNLSALERSATVLADDDGTDPAATSANNNAFFGALRESIGTAVNIAGRTTERQEARDKSQQLAMKLRTISDSVGSPAQTRVIDPVAVQQAIARNPDFDVASLWRALGIPAQLDTVYPQVHVGAVNYMSDATFARCGGACVAEITQAALDAGPVEDLILKIYQDRGPCRFLLFKPIPGATEIPAWQFIGHADHDFWRHYRPDYRTAAIGGRYYFLMSAEGDSGTGISLQYDRWYEFRQADMHEVLSLPAKGHDCMTASSPCREFASTVLSGTDNAAAQGDQFVVNFTVRYSGNQYLVDGTDGEIPLFSRTQRAVYARLSGSADYALTQGSNITPREIQTVFDPDNLTCGDFLAFNANNIAAIASGGDSPAKQWLARYATDCK